MPKDANEVVKTDFELALHFLLEHVCRVRKDILCIDADVHSVEPVHCRIAQMCTRVWANSATGDCTLRTAAFLHVVPSKSNTVVLKNIGCQTLRKRTDDIIQAHPVALTSAVMTSALSMTKLATRCPASLVDAEKKCA